MRIITKYFRIRSKYFWWWTWSSNKKPYGYAVNFARNKFQVIWFLENAENISNISPNTTFADNTDKYVKSSWDTLGIILNPTNYEIITLDDWESEIRIENPTKPYWFIFWKNIEIWNEEIFNKITNLQKYSLTSWCKKLLEKYPDFLNQDDTYTISPDWENIFDVYCDMTRDWWGWTLFWRQISDENRVDLQNQTCSNFNEICNWGLKPYLEIIQDKSEILTYWYNTDKVLFRFKFKWSNSPFIQAFAWNSADIRQYNVFDEMYNDEIYYNDKFQPVPEGHNIQYYSEHWWKSFLVCSAPWSCWQWPVINFGWWKYTNQVSFASSSVDDWSARGDWWNYDYSIWLRE